MLYIQYIIYMYIYIYCSIRFMNYLPMISPSFKPPCKPLVWSPAERQRAQATEQLCDLQGRQQAMPRWRSSW